MLYFDRNGTYLSRTHVGSLRVPINYGPYLEDYAVDRTTGDLYLEYVSYTPPVGFVGSWPMYGGHAFTRIASNGTLLYN